MAGAVAAGALGAAVEVGGRARRCGAGAAPAAVAPAGAGVDACRAANVGKAGEAAVEDVGVGAGAKGAVCPTAAVFVLYGGGRCRPPGAWWAVALTAGEAVGNAGGASSKLTHPEASASRR